MGMAVRKWLSRPGRRRLSAVTAKTMSTCHPVPVLLLLPLTLFVFAGLCDVSHGHGLAVNGDGGKSERKDMEVVGWWGGEEARPRRVVPAGPDRVPGTVVEAGADVETWPYAGSGGGVGGHAKESSLSALRLATPRSNWDAIRLGEEGGHRASPFLNSGPGTSVDPRGDGEHLYGRPTRAAAAAAAALSVRLGVDSVVVATVLEDTVPGLDSGPGSDFVPGLDSGPGSSGDESSGRSAGHRHVAAGHGVDDDGVVVATVVLDDTVPGFVSLPGLNSVPGLYSVPGSYGDVSSGTSGGQQHVGGSAAADGRFPFRTDGGFGGKGLAWQTAGRIQEKAEVAGVAGGRGRGRGGVAGSPGIALTLTQKGLTYTKEVLVNQVLKDMIPLHVPDLRTSSAAEFGEADATLHNIVVSSLKVPESAVDLSAGSVTIFAAGILAHVTLDWKYSLSNPYVPIPIGDEGKADITLHGMQSGVTFTMTEYNGTLVISVIECGSFIEDLKIEMHGGVSWLYNWFIRSFSEKIKTAVEDAITKGLVLSVGKLDSYVQGLPRRLPIDDIAAIDVTIVSDPTMDPDYLSVVTRGEFVSVSGSGSRVAPPLPPPPPGLATACGDVEKMATVALSEFVLNSACAVYHSSGSFHWSVDELPDKSPVRLNTSGWRFMLPQLYRKYPNKAIKLDVRVTSPPAVLLREEGIKAEVQTDLIIQVANATQKELEEGDEGEEEEGDEGEEEDEEEEEGVVKGEGMLVKERGGRKEEEEEVSRLRGGRVGDGEEGGVGERGERRRNAMEALEEEKELERRREGVEELRVVGIEIRKPSSGRGEAEGDVGRRRLRRRKSLRRRRRLRDMAMVRMHKEGQRSIADDGDVSVACLEMTVAIEGVAAIDGNNITGKASLDDLKLTQKWTNIGRIPVSVIQTVVRTVVRGIIVPAINFHLKQGFPLPIVPGVTLKDAVVKYANRSLVVCTDAEYDGQSGSLASNTPLVTDKLTTLLPSSATRGSRDPSRRFVSS